MNKIVVLLALVALIGCSGEDADRASKDKEVSAASYDGAWPFTITNGKVRCTSGKAAVFVADGTGYQMNDAAKGQGYRPIEPIRRNDPKSPGEKISLRGMIGLALKQC